MSAGQNVWNRVRGWWSREAEHLVYRYLPVADQPDPVAQDSYLRFWLTDMFLAQARSRATDQYPALRVSVRLSFAGSPGTTFSTMVQPPPGEEAPGLRAGKLTELLPFAGGTVGVQASLYAVSGTDHLRLAMDVVSGFSSLLMPPLAAVAGVVDKVSGGIDKIEAALEKAGQGPVLALDKEFAPDAVTDALRPGYLVLVSATPEQVDPLGLTVVDGQLRQHGQPLVGYDYLVLYVEVRRQRDDWRFPEWDQMIGQAQEAQLRGEQQRFGRIKDDVLSRIFTSGDLTPVDRRRVAVLVADELAGFQFGAAAGEQLLTVASMVAGRGLPTGASVAGLTLAELVG